MIKLSVMYPDTPGAWFDHDYYRNVHMRLMRQRLGAACKGYSIDKGLPGASGTPPTYVGAGHIYCESVDAFMIAFEPHARELRADMPHYTNLVPVMQFSEMVVD